MGAGKTSVAKALGERLACRMVDLDQIITERERRTPGSYIRELGEDAFREAEAEALRVLLENNRARVIALGGGAWARSRNRDLIAKHRALSVWLDAPFYLCWQRILQSTVERPLASSESAAHALFEDRRAIYALASLHVTIEENTLPDAAALEIENALDSTGEGVG